MQYDFNKVNLSDIASACGFEIKKFNNEYILFDKALVENLMDTDDNLVTFKNPIDALDNIPECIMQDSLIRDAVEGLRLYTKEKVDEFEITYRALADICQKYRDIKEFNEMYGFTIDCINAVDDPDKFVINDICNIENTKTMKEK